jgi:hypothetical protein
MVPYGFAQITNFGLLHFVVGGCGVGGVYKSVRKKNLLRKKTLCSRGGGSVSLSFVHPKK